MSEQWSQDIYGHRLHKRGFPEGSVVKNPPANEGNWVQSQGGEDPLEEEMATHSSILAWKIPRIEEPGGLQSTGLQRATKYARTFMYMKRLKNWIKN